MAETPSKKYISFAQCTFSHKCSSQARNDKSIPEAIAVGQGIDTVIYQNLGGIKVNADRPSTFRPILLQIETDLPTNECSPMHERPRQLQLSHESRLGLSVND